MDVGAEPQSSLRVSPEESREAQASYSNYPEVQKAPWRSKTAAAQVNPIQGKLNLSVYPSGQKELLVVRESSLWILKEP